MKTVIKITSNGERFIKQFSVFSLQFSVKSNGVFAQNWKLKTENLFLSSSVARTHHEAVYGDSAASYDDERDCHRQQGKGKFQAAIIGEECAPVYAQDCDQHGAAYEECAHARQRAQEDHYAAQKFRKGRNS
jgi:hypothetical protein